MSRPLYVLVGVCGILAAGASPALGAFPGENGRIAFVREPEGGDADIWSMKPSGSHQVNLTPDSAANEATPNWSADGRKIAFMSNRVSWTNPTGDHEIFVMAADGSHVRQITRNRLEDEDPAWSPDGRHIVFARNIDPDDDEAGLDLITMKADGSGERNLTKSRGIWEYAPNWSPNGRSIAFASDRGGDVEIWTMSPHGSHQRQLTFNEGEFHDEFPNWSPDSRRISFNRHLGNDIFQIFTMRADGSDQTQLTSETGGLSAWSPDGRQIAFVSDRSGNPELYTMRSNGANQVNRTKHAAGDFFADWQPLRGHR